MVDGAPGSNSMVWSQIVCFGSRWDCSLLKIFVCWEYSCGTLVLSVSWAAPIVTLQSRICSVLMIRGLLMVRGTKHAFAASGF